jgi:hypothetical protein
MASKQANSSDWKWRKRNSASSACSISVSLKGLSKPPFFFLRRYHSAEVPRKPQIPKMKKHVMATPIGDISRRRVNGSSEHCRKGCSGAHTTPAAMAR